jgi:hypothetical protein
MFHLDGSETSWLVYADWLEDHDYDATHIRSPGPVNEWVQPYFIKGVGVCDPGYATYVANRVGANCSVRDVLNVCMYVGINVGTNCGHRINFINNNRVGGSE